ncbi:MAG: hypothetical protein ACYC35_15265 [Pirellulales bacterium]
MATRTKSSLELKLAQCDNVGLRAVALFTAHNQDFMGDLTEFLWPPGNNPHADARYVRAIYSFLYFRFLERAYGELDLRWNKRRPRWDGGQHGSTSYPPVWPSVAKFIREKGLPPFGFIEAKLDVFSKTPPNPDFLLSLDGAEQCIDKVKKDLQKVVGELEFGLRQLASQRAELESAGKFTPEAATSAVVFSRKGSALFRYLLATQGGLQEAADELRPDARRVYLRSPDAYHLAWHALLGCGFLVDVIRSHGIRLL